MSEHQHADSIRRVALIGGTGNVGAHFLKHLLATGKHHVTVLTRPESTATISPNANLTVTKVDYSSSADLTSALRGNEFLIITLTARAPPTLHAEIIAAAKEAGVKYVMPNYYGFGLGPRAGALHQDPILGKFGRTIDDVKNTEGGGVDYIAMVCGFWYEFSLAMGPPWYGFDIKNRRVTFYDDGKRKINTSTWEQCGRAVAALLSLPAQSAGSGKPSVQDWKNEGLYISSFLISQRDMLDSLNRVLGTTDADWKISHEPAQERQKKGLEEMQSGNMLGFAKAMYARLFFSSGEGDYETGEGLDNAKLGLPKEDLDEATKRAVEMVENGVGGYGLDSKVSAS